MRTLLASTLILTAVLAVSGGARAQGTAPGTATPASPGPGTAPGGKSVGDESTSPTTGANVPPTSAFQSPGGNEKSRNATGTTGTAGTPAPAAGALSGSRRGAMRAMHRVTGAVTGIDPSTGRLTLETGEGVVELHLPPGALQGLRVGERVEVELGLRPAASTFP